MCVYIYIYVRFTPDPHLASSSLHLFPPFNPLIHLLPLMCAFLNVTRFQIASYATTVVFIVSILISFYSTREYMVAMRRGKHVFPVRTLHLADACSYVGTQACCVLFGWLTTYIFFFMMLLMYLWAPMRFGYDDFMRAMWGVTIPLYFCSVVFARLVSKLYPVRQS